MIYEEIKNDFLQVKKKSPDIIIVLAHIGRQFLHRTVLKQDKWNEIFVELGADIVLDDHSHTVQPLQYIRNSLIVNSPGNFVNSYIKRDGDSTAIIDIYINKQTKKVVGASAIPMYTKQIRPKYFTAIPIYDLIKNNLISLTEEERKRVEEIQLMSTKVLVGKKYGINEIQKEYFFTNKHYYDFNRSHKNYCDNLNKYSNKIIYKYIKNSSSITFIGDSITKGSKNGHFPWYEPMINCFNKKKIINISRGSFTTKLLLQYFTDDLIDSKSDLYIIAIGTNDVRYRNKGICSMTPKEYINKINEIVNLAKNNNSKFIFIAPWFSFSDDNISNIDHKSKKKLMKKYSLTLKKYAEKNNYIFIDPNEYLEKIIVKNRGKYMVDFIHPNNQDGIELYSESVFINSK